MPPTSPDVTKPAASQDGSLPRTNALPGGFIWGVSTSAFQIEGATREDGRGLSVWDGMGPGAETGDVACDHYHRYMEDIGLMRRLGVQAYRFSVAWPRILPSGRGTANEAGLAFYDRLIDALLDAQIEPWLCLYHWDMPKALDALGGWTTRDCVQWFGDYAAIIGARYGDRVSRFATLNEPSIFTLFTYGFVEGSNTEELAKLYGSIHNVNLSHGAAVDALRARAPGASIGAIHNNQPCRPSSPADKDAARLCDTYWNRAFADPQCLGVYPALLRAAMEPHMRPGDLERIRRPIDWFGLNHYGPVYIKADTGRRLGFNFGDKPADARLTPIGWPADPRGFRETLLGISADYGLPVYVLENGLGGYDSPAADGTLDDHERIDYLRDYITAMNDAVEAGADVRGYFVWSLLDNFEWDSGYKVRFGITYVDYRTQERIPKASFQWYRQVINETRQRSGT